MRAAVIGLCCVLLPVMAAAMSFDGVTLASTPFMPPEEFRWVPLLFLGLFVVANGVLIRWLWAARWREALGGALVLGIALLVVGTVMSVTNYPVQLSTIVWGSPTHWGRGWELSGGEFLFINTFSLLFVVGGALMIAFFHRESPATREHLPAWSGGTCAVIAVLVIFQPANPFRLVPLMVGVPTALLLGGMLAALKRYRWKALMVVGVNVALYAAAITPFVLTGAFVHGTIPHDTCGRTFNVGEYDMALLKFLRAHQGYLPDAHALEDVVTVLQPYYDQEMGEGSPLPTICPGGLWRDRAPRPYVWNPAVAGKRIDDLRTLKEPVVIFSCPYHPWNAIDSAGLVAAYDDPKAVFIMKR